MAAQAPDGATLQTSHPERRQGGERAAGLCVGGSRKWQARSLWSPVWKVLMKHMKRNTSLTFALTFRSQVLPQGKRTQVGGAASWGSSSGPNTLSLRAQQPSSRVNALRDKYLPPFKEATCLFIAALFTTAPNRGQRKRPLSVGEQMLAEACF